MDGDRRTRRSKQVLFATVRMRLKRYELTGHLIISREPLHYGRSNDLTITYQGWEKENMCTHPFFLRKNL
jgi:hypothetical protein